MARAAACPLAGMNYKEKEAAGYCSRARRSLSLGCFSDATFSPSTSLSLSAHAVPGAGLLLRQEARVADTVSPGALAQGIDSRSPCCPRRDGAGIARLASTHRACPALPPCGRLCRRMTGPCWMTPRPTRPLASTAATASTSRRCTSFSPTTLTRGASACCGEGARGRARVHTAVWPRLTFCVPRGRLQLRRPQCQHSQRVL